MKFEERLADLETIVGKLEEGELSLEEALGLFERGIGLVRELTRHLDQVEGRLEVLVRNAEGALEIRESDEEDFERGD